MWGVGCERVWAPGYMRAARNLEKSPCFLYHSFHNRTELKGRKRTVLLGKSKTS